MKTNRIDYKKKYEIQKLFYAQHGCKDRPQDRVRFDAITTIFYDLESDLNSTPNCESGNIALHT